MNQGFPLTRDEAVLAARSLVLHRYPAARCAWLAGSVATGTATATSDLDVTVLLHGSPAPLRESLLVRGLPVELFIQTAESLERFLAADRLRRQPTTAHLVAGGLILLDADGSARAFMDQCMAEIMAGPDPLPGNEVDAARYAVSTLISDLEGSQDEQERAVIAATLWERAARLLLSVDQQWQGTGKGLLHALVVRDRAYRDTVGAALTAALVHATDEPTALSDAAGLVLERCGGPLFEGYRVDG